MTRVRESSIRRRIFSRFGTTNTIAHVADTSNAQGEASYVMNFLVLPTGQVLQTDFNSTVEIYTPSGSANSSWARRS